MGRRGNVEQIVGWEDETRAGQVSKQKESYGMGVLE